MPLLSLATLPSSTTFLASVGEWSGSIFSDLLPFAIYAIGIILGVGLIAFIIFIIFKGLSMLIHRD